MMEVVGNITARLILLYNNFKCFLFASCMTGDERHCKEVVFAVV